MGPVSAIFLGMAMASTGCITVDVTHRNQDVLVRAYSETKRLPETDFAVKRLEVEDSEVVRAIVEIERSVACDRVEHRVVDRTTETLRTTEESGGLTVEYLVGAVGLSLLTLGAYLESQRDPAAEAAQERSSPGSTSDAKAGHVLLIGSGAVLSPVLVFGVINSARLVDSSEYVGHVDEITSTQRDRCDVAPATGIDVQLLGDGGQLVASGTTDDQGRAKLSLSASDIDHLSSSSKLTVSGKAQPKDALEPILALAARRAAEARAAREQAITERELESNRCEQLRFDVQQEALARYKLLLEGVGTSFDGDHFVLRGHDIVVATPEGTEVDLGTPITGETHLFAAGYSPVELEVTDPRGYAIQRRSAWESVVGTTGAESSSRVVEGRIGDTLTIRVKGRGCTLVFAARHF